MKSQILAGGRGLGTFKSGFKGGVHVTKRNEVEQVAGLCILWFQFFQFKMWIGKFNADGPTNGIDQYLDRLMAVLYFK